MEPRKLTDFIRVYDDALSPDVCSQMVLAFEAAPKTQTKIEGFREFYECPVNEFGAIMARTPVAHADFSKPAPTYTEVIVKAMRAHLNRYQKDAGVAPGDWPKEVGFEKLRMKRYDQGEGQFGRHVDVADYASARRFLVFFFYINDVEEGGETAFYGEGEEPIMVVKPKRGSLLMFPPLWTFPHAGMMPKSGPKYIAGGYLHYT